MEPQESSPTEAAQSTEMRRLTGVFHEPGAVFADIAGNGRWWLPLLILAVLSSVFVSLMVQYVGYEQMIQRANENSQRVQQMPEEQRQKVLESQRKITPIVARAAPLVGVLIVTLVMAGVLLLVFNWMLDAGLRYKQALNICAYASLPPGIVATAASTLVMYLKPPDEFDPQNPLAFNLGAFLSKDTAKWLMSLASSIDLFTFWSIALLAIGFSAACGARKMPVGRAARAILLPWALWVLGKMALSSVFG